MVDPDELAGPHEQWCQNHALCCGPSDCDCGRDERRDGIAQALTEAYGQGRDDEADGKPLPPDWVLAATEHEHAWIDDSTFGEAREICLTCRKRRPQTGRVRIGGTYVSFDELQTAAYYAMQPEGSRPECSVFQCSTEGVQFTDDQQWMCLEHMR